LTELPGGKPSFRIPSNGRRITARVILWRRRLPGSLLALLQSLPLRFLRRQNGLALGLGLAGDLGEAISLGLAGCFCRFCRLPGG
jgi:hypothetical protein